MRRSEIRVAYGDKKVSVVERCGCLGLSFVERCDGLLGVGFHVWWCSGIVIIVGGLRVGFTLKGCYLWKNK